MSFSINQTTVRSGCKPAPLSLMGRLRNLVALSRQRRQLAALEDHLLQDIGVTQTQAKQESAKTPWDVPAHWHN